MIRIMTRLMPLLTLLLFTAMAVKAQTAAKAETLTNKNVVEISKAGLGNDIIIAKINSSACKFDLSTTALIDLKKQGVSPEVISSMMNKTNGKAVVAEQPVGATPAAAQNKKTTLPVINQLNYVHYYDKGLPMPLEKSLGTSESKKVLFGYKGSNLLLKIPGETSPVKLGSGMTDAFVINMGGNNLPDMVLYKLKSENNKRYAVVGKLTLSGPKSGEDMMPIEISKVGDGMYSIKPGSKLEKGEYFFTNKPNLNQSTSSSDVYAFTIL